MRLRPLYVLLAVALTSFVSAGTDDDQPAPDPNNKAVSNPGHIFSQLIDHTQPSLGTFNQRYFFSDEFWTGQGAPIIIFNVGEQSAENFTTALQTSSALITDRYWGNSSPYQTLTTANLKYLTVDQSIEDMKYFIETVSLPWKKAKDVISRPDASPWVHLGCSYPGLLAAYTQNKYPNLFAAAWASSAPVQAQGDFWQYFEPIEEGMPKNCSKDVAAVITAIDNILLNGSKDQKHELKETFGLEDLKDDGDFGRRLTFPLFDWQSLTASTYKYFPDRHVFFQFCDAIETRLDNTTETSADGVGVERARDNYAAWMKNQTLAVKDCPGGGCFTTFNYEWPQYTDWAVKSKYVNRQWWWMTCTELGWWQDGDPGNYSSIVSSFVTEEWNLRQCNHMFPNADGAPGNFRPSKFGADAEHAGQNVQSGNLFVVNVGGNPGNFHPDVFDINKNHGGGWNLQANNLFVVNGQFDPWRSASLSSKWAPAFQDTPHQHVEIVKEGHHCWDWNLNEAALNPDIKRVVDLGISTVKGWLEEWYGSHPNVKNSMPKVGGECWEGVTFI